ncbi:MAG: DNA-3-methyladenine glycosylase [Streptosporangiaceae bacterium]
MSREFYRRPAPEVAPDLLGCVLVHDTPLGRVAVEIVEVEAYTGQTDPASHAFRGKTDRNAVMFGDPGHAYVYFTYGMHFCVNLVCQPAGEAAAVLLRAGRVIDGEDLAAARRAGQSGAGQSGAGQSRAGQSGVGAGSRLGRAARHLASGPARLCQALGIDRALNGADVCDPGGSLRVLVPLAGVAEPAGQGRDRGWPVRLPADQIARGPRVGVRDGAEVEWRFWIAADPVVSAYRPHVQRRRGGQSPVSLAARPGRRLHGGAGCTAAQAGGPVIVVNFQSAVLCRPDSLKIARDHGRARATGISTRTAGPADGSMHR